MTREIARSGPAAKASTLAVPPSPAAAKAVVRTVMTFIVSALSTFTRTLPA
jgi:hypothetical protein